MLVENQEVEVKWSKRNREHYISKGYKFTKYGDYFIVHVEDLPYGSNIKVKVLCEYCNEERHPRWRDYLKQKDNKYACQHCRQIRTSENSLKERQNYLYNKALNFCNSKGYVLLTKKDEVSDSNTYVTYECLKHGIHNTKLYSLISGHGCFECGREESANKRMLSIEHIISTFEKFGAGLLNPHDYIGWDVKNLKTPCLECGDVFLTSYNSFVKHEGQYCPKCSSTESNGEKRVRAYLEANNILFNQEYRFDDCKDKNTLPFDFYLPEYNTCVEYQGLQHYEPIEYFGGDIRLRNVQKHDQIKKQYCISHGLRLIEIPYWDMKNIEKILDKELILHEDIV